MVPGTLTGVERSPAAAEVTPLRALHAPDVLVTLPRAVTAAQLAAVRSLAHVDAVERLDVGQLTVGHAKARALGVDPSSFRGWTPKQSAASDPLWRSVAAGELTVSFDMARDARLPLGATLPVRGGGVSSPMRIGAFASTGLAGIDAVVDRRLSPRFGLTRDAGLLLSAPGADPMALRETLRSRLGAGADVQLLRQVVVVRDAGEFLTRGQLTTILRTALGRVGAPYVWGATGPKAFDCSGLVGYAFRAGGVALPRTAAQQFYAGTHVRYTDARPGDLLFWTYDPTAPGFVDHVAIYLGNGRMVVAPHTGEVVHVAPVPLAHLAGVVRVDPHAAADLGS